MQTWITDKDFYISASNLTRQHLQANIYESIQILASLLDCTDKLVNPKRNVKNHPVAKLWEGCENELFYYISSHLSLWKTKYKSEINDKNMAIILNSGYLTILFKTPSWITDEFIQTHRSVLIQKEIEKNIKMIIKKYPNYQGISDKEEFKKMEKRLSYHYRNLWPDCPLDLKMHYNWRGLDENNRSIQKYE